MRIHIFSCLSVALLFTVAACSDGDEGSTPTTLQGSWNNDTETVDPSELHRIQYVFDEDGTIETYLKVVDSNTGGTLGYRFYGTGTYTILDNELSIHLTEIFTNDDTESDHAPIDELERSASTTQYIQGTVEWISASMIRIIYPPCGPNENCIPFLVLTKD